MMKMNHVSGPARFVVVGLSVWASCGLVLPAAAEEWPQWRGGQRDGQWRESGLVDSLPTSPMSRKWTAEIGAGYSGPTVALGRVFVTDRVADPDETERIHCFDWETGEPLWSHVYPCSYEGVRYTAGPRASVTVDHGAAYALGGTGHLHCLDAESGEVLWARDLREDFQIEMPNWGIAAAPLIEDDLVIVQINGEGEACLVALDKATGQSRWESLADDASYSAPITIDQGGQRVVVCWTGERVVGVDPADGSLLWAHPFKWEKWPIGIATPVVHDDFLLISEAHKGTLLLKLLDDPPAVEPVWHRRENGEPALHSLMTTPLIIDEHIYGCDSSGILRCLELDTGEQVWEEDSVVPPLRWATIHMVRNRDRVWILNDDGELIVAQLTPDGFEEHGRSKLLDPTTEQLRRRDGVTWAHPAFAYRHVFARNDEELVCADLSADTEH